MQQSSIPRAVLRLASKFYFAGRVRFIFIILGQFITSLLENISIVALFPILYSMSGITLTEEKSQLVTIIDNTLSALGIPQNFIVLLGLLSGVILLKIVLTVLVELYSGYVALNIVSKDRQSLLNKTLRARWDFFVNTVTGQYGNLIGRESGQVVTSMNCSLMLISGALSMLLYLATALSISWKLTALALLGGLVFIVALRPFLQQVRHASHAQTSALNTMSARMVELFSAIKSIKAMGLEENSSALLREEEKELLAAQKKSLLGTLCLKNGQQLITTLFLIVILSVSHAYLHVDPASLFVSAVLFNRMLVHISTLQTRVQRILNCEGGVSAMEKAITDAHKFKEMQVNVDGQVPSLKKSIQYNNFGISHGKHLILHKVNVTIPSCKTTIILGASGGGKTTLIDSLLGFHPHYEGSITVDGTSLRQINMRSWREKVGYLPQDVFLFHASIHDNITMGGDYSEEEVREALSIANADSFIKKLPHNIHTTVGEKGSKLSGGERQRIALARAVIRKPNLLLLDEVTSALDPKNTRQVIDAIAKVSQHVTTVIITHDNQLIDFADQVLEVNNHTIKKVRKA